MFKPFTKSKRTHTRALPQPALLLGISNILPKSIVAQSLTISGIASYVCIVGAFGHMP